MELAAGLTTTAGSARRGAGRTLASASPRPGSPVTSGWTVRCQRLDEVGRAGDGPSVDPAGSEPASIVVRVLRAGPATSPGRQQLAAPAARRATPGTRPRPRSARVARRWTAAELELRTRGAPDRTGAGARGMDGDADIDQNVELGGPMCRRGSGCCWSSLGMGASRRCRTPYRSGRTSARSPPPGPGVADVRGVRGEDREDLVTPLAGTVTVASRGVLPVSVAATTLPVAPPGSSG
jgi:hypothetical protein